MSRMDKTDYLKLIDDIIATGRYKADWSSLAGHRLPSWYYEGKFGIFIHWGIYSVPAYACEWYPRWMYNPGSREYEYHKKNFGDPSEFGYKDFIPMPACSYNLFCWVYQYPKDKVQYLCRFQAHHI